MGVTAFSVMSPADLKGISDTDEQRIGSRWLTTSVAISPTQPKETRRKPPCFEMDINNHRKKHSAFSIQTQVPIGEATITMRLFNILIPLLMMSQLVSADGPVRERIEWIDIWVTDAHKNDLPRVLLVGDSITRGYFGDTEKLLAGKASCARLTTSKCVSDPTFNDDLQLLLRQYKFSAIHFNNGLHGWGYTEDQYRDGLTQTVAAMKEYAADTKFIWATTTPVRAKNDLQEFEERTKRVRVRNEIAAAIMKEHGFATNDLFVLVEKHPEWHSSDGVHFNAKGKKAQAKQVAKSVMNWLPIPK